MTWQVLVLERERERGESEVRKKEVKRCADTKGFELGYEETQTCQPFHQNTREVRHVIC